MRSLESPTARALRTLELLQIRPGLTGAELASLLGVSDRAARRYVAILREAGIAVDSTSGPYGGYRLGRGLHLQPLLFTASEALGLVMAVLDGHHAASDSTEPVGSALGKLISALPKPVRKQADTMRRHASVAPDRGAARPDPGITSALVDAIADRHRVHLSYASQSGSRWQSDVDPWAVIVRHARWYLLCFAHHVNASRAYRIDRIERLEAVDDTFEPPPDLDPVGWLQEHLSTGWEYETHVIFDAPLATVSPHIRSTMGHLVASDDGARCILRGSTSNPAMYAGDWLAAIPVDLRVVGGPELHEAVVEVGRRMTGAIGPDPIPTT